MDCPKPSREELRAAAGRTVPDVLARDLVVLFSGINPGLYSAAVGHHFARPGNRYWPALYRSGFTPRLYSPCEDQDLLSLGYGITNIAQRATARADDLSLHELVEGAKRLHEKVARDRPRYVAILGVGAYRLAFRRPTTQIGPQPEDLAGSRWWILPNPSGLNAHYPLDNLVALFGELRSVVLQTGPGERQAR